MNEQQAGWVLAVALSGLVIVTYVWVVAMIVRGTRGRQ